jgi:hypothetical protein
MLADQSWNGSEDERGVLLLLIRLEVVERMVENKPACDTDGQTHANRGEDESELVEEQVACEWNCEESLFSCPGLTAKRAFSCQGLIAPHSVWSR